MNRLVMLNHKNSIRKKVLFYSIETIIVSVFLTVIIMFFAAYTSIRQMATAYSDIALKYISATVKTKQEEIDSVIRSISFNDKLLSYLNKIRLGERDNGAFLEIDRFLGKSILLDESIETIQIYSVLQTDRNIEFFRERGIYNIRQRNQFLQMANDFKLNDHSKEAVMVNIDGEDILVYMFKINNYIINKEVGIGVITLDPLAFDIANNIVDEREFRYRILDGKGNIVMGDNLDALDPNDANYIVTESDLEYNQWKLLSVVSINKYISRVFHALEIILVFALLGIAACLLINKKLTELLVRPIEKLTKYMRKVEKGEFGVQIENVAQGELGYLQNQFNHMNRTIKRLMEERIEREHLKRKAEIAMLTAQINPHFLYNTLNTINCIAKLEGQKSISDMVVDLGEILRYSITNSEELVPLSLEVLYLLKYCNIMNARFGGNIVLEKEIEPGLENHLMPKLLLQPIVENSFKHAFSNKSQGRIIIKASQNTGVIYVSISDDGDGIDENQCELINKSMEEMSQTEEIGLKNVNQRIKLYYGAEYGISISSQKSKGTTINLTLKGETL